MASAPFPPRGSSYAVIVQLIGNTTTTTGLAVCAELDERAYSTQETVTPQQLAQVQLRPGMIHGERNYTIAPHR